MPTIPSGYKLYSADMYVYYYYFDAVTDGSLTVGAYQVMHSWKEYGLTWDIAAPDTNTYISSTRLSTGQMSGARGAYINSPQTTSFDVTAAAAAWYADPSTNNGIALKYESGTNISVILKTYEAGADHRSYFVITYVEESNISGVYKIKNANNGLYLDVTDGGTTAGTPMQQWSGTSTDNNLNQLFKITFVKTVGTTDPVNYYTIRPMTNSQMGLEAEFSGINRNATIESIWYKDNWSDLLYNHVWAISKNGNYYTIKNGRVDDNSYLTAPSNTTNGAAIYTSDTIYDTSKWIFEPYTGEPIEETHFFNNTSGLMVGEKFTFDAYMRSSSIGVNGPVQYSVTNSDGTATDKATINSLGVVNALKFGKINVRATYSGAPWIWYYTVDIFDMEHMIIYRTRNRERLGFADMSDNNDITPITAEDLLYGLKTKKELTEDPLNFKESDFGSDNNILSVSQRVEKIQALFNDYLSEDDVFRTILPEMLKHFVEGKGEDFSNSALTNEVKNHAKTEKYVNGVVDIVKEQISSFKGRIANLHYDEELWVQPAQRKRTRDS